MTRHVNKFSKKFTKQERAAQRKVLLEHHQHGEGIFRFKNKHKATLELPKAALDGRTVVGPGEEWDGDNYFMKMVPREAILVKCIQPPTPKEEIMAEQKLILDQPDTVTNSGKVEHVVADNNVKPLTEQQPGQKETLLTEDPMAGITILKD